MTMDRARARRDEAEIAHAADDALLPRLRAVRIAIRIERRRTMGQGREVGGLRVREHRRRCAEIGAAGAFGAGELIAVGCGVEIERENLRLRQPVFEAQRDDRFLDLRAPVARP
jgi:hypothetical protein